MDVSTWDAAALARELRPIRQDVQKRPKGGGASYWYRGDEHYFELMIELDPQGLPTWFQLSIRGCSVTYDCETTLISTGRTEDGRALQGPLSGFGAKLFVEDREPDEELIAFAHALVSARATDPGFKEILVVF